MDLISEPIQMTPHSQPYQDIAKGNFLKILSKKEHISVIFTELYCEHGP